MTGGWGAGRFRRGDSARTNPWAGDIGADPHEVEFEPIEEPSSVPEPVRVPEPERVPVPA